MAWRSRLQRELPQKVDRAQSEVPLEVPIRKGVQLPVPRCRKLWGREADLRRIISLLGSETAPPWVGLFAFGGYGNSELARATATQVLARDLLEDAVWLTFREEEFLLLSGHTESGGRKGERRTVEDTMSILAVQLGTNLERVADALQDARYLVVLDNFETAPNPRALLGRLAGMLGRSKVLITSRRRLAAPIIEDVSVEGLSREDTFALLGSEAAARNRRQILDAPEATFERIFRITRGAPLALHLIVAQVAFLEIDRVLAALRGGKGPSKTLYSFLLRKAWAHLAANARSLLIYMGTTGEAAIPRNEFEGAGLSEVPDVDEALLQLAEWSLVEVVEEADTGQLVYDLHPLTRAFVRSDLREEWQGQWENYARHAVRTRLERLRRG